MSKRIFVDVSELYDNLRLSEITDDNELFVPLNVLRIAIAKSTQIIVAGAEDKEN